MLMTLLSLRSDPDLIRCALHVFPEVTGRNILVLHQNEEGLGRITAGQIRQQLPTGKLAYSMDTNAKIHYSKHPFLNAAHLVIWVIDTENLLESIKNVRENMLWSPKSPMLIILLTDSITEEQLFSMLWKEARVSKVVVLSKGLKFYTWKPFKQNECNVDITKLETAECIGHHINKTRPFIFPSEIESFNNCPIYYVASLVYPYVGSDSVSGHYTHGLEISIVHTLTEKYGGFLEHVDLEKDEAFYMYESFEPWTGAARLLSTYQVDLSFGSMFQSSQHSGYADMLELPHSNDQLIWFIPQPVESGTIHNIYRAFETNVWFPVLAAWGLVSLTTYILQKKQPGFGYHALQAFSIFLSYPISHPRSHLLRMFLLVGYLFSINIVTAYQAALTSFLTKPLMESDVTSVHEAIDKGLKPYMYQPHRPYIERPDFPDYHLLQSTPHEFRQEMKFETMQTMNDKIILGVRSTTLFYLIWKRKFDKRGKLLVKPLEPGVLSFHVTILTSKGNPIKKKLDELVKRLVESGIKIKWHRDLIDKNVRMRRGASIHRAPLTVPSIMGALWVLPLGITSASVILILEVLIEKFKTS